MNPRMMSIAAAAILALAVSWGRAAEQAAPRPPAPETLVAIREAQTVVREMNAALSGVFKATREAFPDRISKVVAELQDIDRRIVAGIDPVGLRVGVMGLSERLYRADMDITGMPMEKLKPFTVELREMLTRLEALAGPAVQAEIETRHREEALLQELTAVRRALNTYRNDHGGCSPLDPAAELAPRYLERIPVLEVPGHKPSSEVVVLSSVEDRKDLETQLTDSGRWTYVADYDSPLFGRFFIDCSHSDARGRVWRGF